MKKIDLTKDRNMLFFFGAAIGALLFIITYGTAILDPGYDAWIMTSPDIDIRQHYVGFLNFINDPWTFPIGNTNSLSYPHMMSIVWTDSIPGLCILAKLFRFMLPKTPQIFGIYGIVTFALNGAFASLLVYEVTKNRTAAVLSSPFFIMSFTVIHRMYYHTALASHWIILASLLYFYTDRKYSIKRDAFVYGLLSFLCVSVHSYFLPMAGGILLFDTVYINRDKTKKTLSMLIPLLSFCISGIVTLLLYGAFTSKVEHGGFAIGEFYCNLNTFFNSLGHGILPELPLVRDTQYEGFGYLGLGILVMCVICGAFLLYRAVRAGFKGTKEFLKDHFRITLTMIMALFFAVISVFPEVDINGTVIVPDILPFAIKKLFGIFRSNGRFIWPLMYIIMLSCVYILLKMTKKTAVAYILIAVCLFLQGADLKPWVSEKHAFYTEKHEFRTLFEDHGPDPDTYKHIVMVLDNGDLKMETGYFAANNDKTINMFYFARVIDNIENAQLEKYKEEALSGNPEPETIYFFDDEKLKEWEGAGLTIEKVRDDLYIGY